MKDFLIIGNLNAVTYQQVFPLIKGGEVRLGVSIHSGDREFEVADDYPLEAAGYRVGADGRKFIRVKGVRWFTTLPTNGCPPLTLTATYTPEAYPRYDNYDAIEVARTKDIPCDYYGVMGVPISFLDKYCPEQFEIVGVTYNYGRPDCFPKDCCMAPRIAGRCAYRRILIRRRK